MPPEPADAAPGRTTGRGPFIFGIPLIARACTPDWERVGDLLGLTLRSLLAQTDPDFSVLLAGHDLPRCWAELTRGDPRFRFLQADWDPEAPTSHNDDGGRKKWMIGDEARRGGGGLLMYLDADDLVDRRLVEVARATLRPHHVGAVLDGGLIVDFASLRAVPLPDPRVYDGEFLELCGSSTIGRIEPESDDPVRRDPHEALGSHHLWTRSAAEAGVALARLPVWGAYLVNTSQNHSELHGPHSDWRRTLNAAIARVGAPLDEAMAARFGVELGQVRAVSPPAAAGAGPFAQD